MNLAYFPPYQENKIYDSTKCFSLRELSEIFYSALPYHWIEKLREHGMEATDDSVTFDNLIRQCEIFQAIDAARPKELQPREIKKHERDEDHTDNYKHHHKKDDQIKSATEVIQKWCIYHNSSTHDSNDCHQLKQLIQHTKEKSQSKPKSELKSKEHNLAIEQRQSFTEYSETTDEENEVDSYSSSIGNERRTH